MNISAVFFDAVGTLLRPQPSVQEVYGRAGRRCGARLGEAEIGRRFAAAFQRQEAVDRELGYRSSERRERQRWEAIVAEVFRDQPHPSALLAELWDHFARPDAWACLPDVAACLRELQLLGIPLGIASNFDGRLRAVVAGQPALAACGRLAISAEIGWRKPAPAFFEALCELVRLPAEEILLVGDDWHNDYEGGRQAGLQVLLLDRNARLGEAGRLTGLDELPSRLSV